MTFNAMSSNLADAAIRVWNFTWALLNFCSTPEVLTDMAKYVAKALRSSPVGWIFQLSILATIIKRRPPGLTSVSNSRPEMGGQR